MEQNRLELLREACVAHEGHGKPADGAPDVDIRGHSSGDCTLLPSDAGLLPRASLLGLTSADLCPAALGGAWTGCSSWIPVPIGPPLSLDTPQQLPAALPCAAPSATTLPPASSLERTSSIGSWCRSLPAPRTQLSQRRRLCATSPG